MTEPATLKAMLRDTGWFAFCHVVPYACILSALYLDPWLSGVLLWVNVVVGLLGVLLMLGLTAWAWAVTAKPLYTLAKWIVLQNEQEATP